MDRLIVITRVVLDFNVYLKYTSSGKVTLIRNRYFGWKLNLNHTKDALVYAGNMSV